MFLLLWTHPPSCASILRYPTALCSFSTARIAREALLPSQRSGYDAKYADKLQRRAQEQGRTVADLRAELKKQEQERRAQRLSIQERARIPPTIPSSIPLAHNTQPVSASSPSSRKDSSPVKPLSSILSIDKLLETPHTPEQVSALWRAYHGSRSGGTGRGYLCGTVPVESYKTMLDIATKYPTFVLPVPRNNAQTETKDPAYEFYLMEWGLHGPPLESARAHHLFTPPKASSNPQTSTVLFTPLQEYKLRQSFATPYLVLTHYTDLVESHGLVLLRGEITPSMASTGVGDGEAGGRFMLSQQDAQLLTMHVQRFYLWRSGLEVKTFHERPEEFKWEELLKHTDVSG